MVFINEVSIAKQIQLEKKDLGLRVSLGSQHKPDRIKLKQILKQENVRITKPAGPSLTQLLLQQGKPQTTKP